MINHYLVKEKLCMTLCLCALVFKKYCHKDSKTQSFTKTGFSQFRISIADLQK
jgi:hypothetical protein